jgi:hypothetical protein
MRLFIAFLAVTLIGALSLLFWMWRRPSSLDSVNPISGSQDASLPLETRMPVEKPGWCDLQGIVGSDVPCQLDPRLARLARQLAEPPFEHFSCFRSTTDFVMPSIEWLGTEAGQHQYRARLPFDSSTRYFAGPKRPDEPGNQLLQWRAAAQSRRRRDIARGAAS